jgi:hypothetical protein
MARAVSSFPIWGMAIPPRGSIASFSGVRFIPQGSVRANSVSRPLGGGSRGPASLPQRSPGAGRPKLAP